MSLLFSLDRRLRVNWLTGITMRGCDAGLPHLSKRQGWLPDLTQDGCPKDVLAGIIRTPRDLVDGQNERTDWLRSLGLTNGSSALRFFLQD
jgi:hypothetical protein